MGYRIHFIGPNLFYQSSNSTHHMHFEQPVNWLMHSRSLKNRQFLNTNLHLAHTLCDDKGLHTTTNWWSVKMWHANIVTTVRVLSAVGWHRLGGKAWAHQVLWHLLATVLWFPRISCKPVVNCPTLSVHPVQMMASASVLADRSSCSSPSTHSHHKKRCGTAVSLSPQKKKKTTKKNCGEKNVLKPPFAKPAPIWRGLDTVANTVTL